MFIEIMMTDYILTEWKKAPNRSKRSYRAIGDWQTGEPEMRRSLTRSEVRRYKAFLKKHAPTSYRKLFPDEHTP
jgi:hypothetical protein